MQRNNVVTVGLTDSEDNWKNVLRNISYSVVYGYFSH